MTRRLLVAIVTTIIWAALLAMVMQWLLPRTGINIPFAGLIAMMAALLAYSIISYRLATPTLKKEPVVGAEAMIGRKGNVITRLAPDGMVQVGDELWKACSPGEIIDIGDEVSIIGLEGLKLIVEKTNQPSNTASEPENNCQR